MSPPLNHPLLRKLIARDIIRDGTEIDVSYRGFDLSRNPTIPTTGTFIIRQIAVTDEGVQFTAQSVVNGATRRVSADALIKIDGMDLNRLGENFGLDPNGERIPQGKRRGRKPKIPRPEDLEAEAEAAALAQADADDEEDDEDEEITDVAA